MPIEIPPEPPFQKHEDKPIEELLPLMKAWIKNGFKTYVRWTCPTCGERVHSSEPNTIHTSYIHTEKADGSQCGAVYQVGVLGFMAIAGDAKVD